MKRKLISYDVFESIQNDSLSAAENELAAAGPILSNALEVENLELSSFGSDTALFEAADGTFVQTNYKIDKNQKIQFENITQLAIDTETEKTASRKSVEKMVDALLENNEDKAKACFEEYMSLPLVRRNLKESFKPVASISTGMGKKSKFRGKHRAGGHSAALKAAQTRKKNDKLESPAAKAKRKALAEAEKKKLGGKALQTKKGQRSVRTYVRRSGGKKMREWTNLCENVFKYVDYRNIGPILSESSAAHDDNGNIVALTIPAEKARNEAKLLSFNWKTMKTDVKVLRSGAKVMAEDTKFCKAVADIKRFNAVSDNAALEEGMENLVTQWPGVLYLTQDELTATLKEALETAKATNFDDQTCAFMAEGILRTAHAAYVDRVSKIMSLAGVKSDAEAQDKYAGFKETVDSFYPTLDEGAALEMQVYVDLYEALRNVYELADDENDEIVANETANHLNELAAIIQKEVEPSLEVAEAAAEWLNWLVESNLEGGEWSVSNSTHSTENGDHPQMMKNAAKGYTPSTDFSGKYPSSGPVSDGKTIGSGDEMRNSSWGNIGGKDSYPDLKNPYIPAPFGDYTMKGEKGVDKEEGELATPKGSDTWPALQNPYIPKSVEVKMKADDLVQDA